MSIYDAKLNPKNPGMVKWHVIRHLTNLAEKTSNFLTYDQIKENVPDAMIEDNKNSELYFKTIQRTLLDFMYPVFIRKDVRDLIGDLEELSNHKEYYARRKACLNLGKIYLEGKIVKKDLDKAIEWFEKLPIFDEPTTKEGKVSDAQILFFSSIALKEKALTLKDQDSQFEMAEKYYQRCELAAHLSDTIFDKHLKSMPTISDESAEFGRQNGQTVGSLYPCPDAQLELLYFHVDQHKSYGRESDLEYATKFAKMATKHNHPSSFCFYAGGLLKKSPDKFYETLRKGAELGNQHSMVMMGDEHNVEGIVIPSLPSMLEKIAWNEIAISNELNPETKKILNQRNKVLLEKIKKVDDNELCGKSKSKFLEDVMGEIKSIKDEKIEKIRLNKNYLWEKNHLGTLTGMDIFDQNYSW